jgi:hypothetical protein
MKRETMKHKLFTISNLIIVITALYGQVDNSIKLPIIGQWLINENSVPAQWLGQKYKDRLLQEPINIIIIDQYSKSESDAINKILNACKK